MVLWPFVATTLYRVATDGYHLATTGEKPILTTTIDDRITYASFPASLKTAMKAAANRNGWCRESWRLQTAMIQEAMLSGYDVDTLAAGYQEAVHG